jgi:hypothetical protein
MSEPKIEAFGVVKNGQLQIKGRKQFDFQLQQFESKDVEIIVKRKKKKRNNNQNSLYWLWIAILAAEIGLTKEQLHDLVKYKFLLKKVHLVNGCICELQGDFYVDIKSGELIEGTVKEIELIRSTTELSVSEFAEFMTDFKQWAMDFFNVHLPDPNEQTEIF